MHGESFNEGPRQAAYLMPGMGNVHFPISTKNPLAQRFFDQGVSQLHGFWYFEAERSFRQAAALDHEHPMPYWGMARANIENHERSLGFIEQAKKRIEKANDKERRLIEAWGERVQKAPPAGAEPDATQPAKPEDEQQKDKEARDARVAKLKKYMSDLDSIAVDFPDDIELKAMIVLQAWQNDGDGVPIQSFSSMNSLLDQILKVNPRHPAHHFRIHLWDYKKEQLAVQSAAMCGPSAPGIAHMWHMPGHTYSRLKRYHDAAWQQEASARVDHAHMMRDRVMPDQIHNYSHNNEWLIRSLSLIGRPSRAISLAKNMIELPRHPKFNTFDNRGSSRYGRERLIEVLTQYEMWDELLQVTDSPYLPPDSDEQRANERLGWRAIAAIQSNRLDIAEGAKTELETLSKQLDEEESQKLALIEKMKSESTPQETGSSEVTIAPQQDTPPADGAKVDGSNSDASNPEISGCLTPCEPPHAAAETQAPATTEAQAPAPKEPPPPPTAEDLLGKSDASDLPQEIDKDWTLPPDEESKKWSEERKNAERELHNIRYRKQKLSHWTTAINAYHAASKRDYHEALKLSHRARRVVRESTRVEWLAQGGFAAEAAKLGEKEVSDHPSEFLPLVRGALLQCLAPDRSEQLNAMLETLKPLAATAEPETKPLQRLKKLLDEKNIAVDWNTSQKAASDIGERPALDTLGPYRWSPSPAPMWHAITPSGEEFSSKKMVGKPYVVILYLGSGCLHCVEQLGVMSPKMEEFKKLGLELVAISTEDPAQLRNGISSFDKPIVFPLLSNAEQDTFKGFRAYDDFEGQPLHGTFLIDAGGRILWQDIGHEPFMDVDFLFGESKRLLELSGQGR